MFIPKAGKASHVTPKDFRPMKTFERLLEVHMKSTISYILLSDSHNADRIEKWTETALHSIVSCIERSFHRQEFTLIAYRRGFQECTPRSDHERSTKTQYRNTLSESHTRIEKFCLP